MTNFSVERINHSSYKIVCNEQTYKVKIERSVPAILRGTDSDAKKLRRQEFFYNLVTDLAKGISEKNRPESFKIGYKTWHVSEYEKKISLVNQIAGIIPYTKGLGHAKGIIKKPEDVIRLKIKDNFRIPFERLIPIHGIQNADELAETSYNLCHATKESYKADQIAANRLQGVLESERCGGLAYSEQLLTHFSSTPFTSLSTIAFQKHEREYFGTDFFTPEQCLTCFQLYGDDELRLIEKSKINHSDEIQKNRNRKTVELFIKRIKMEFGEAKFNYISHKYKINLDGLLEKGLPLTPEHVYRMNIGLQNIEIDDVKDLFSALKGLSTIMSVQKDSKPLIGILERIKNSDLSVESRKAELEEANFQKIESKTLKSKESKLKEISSQKFHFSISQMRGVISILQQGKSNDDPVTVGDLKEWLKVFEGHEIEHFSSLPLEPLNRLMTALTPTMLDLDRTYTGRKILRIINAGDYTLAKTAGNQELKPWIDQHELLHFFSELENASSLHSYYEKLAHVLCKKHLFRHHPTLGIKTGAVIPAPTDEKGNKRWYLVEEFVSNAYGKACYSLTPLGNDKSLPHIKLYRSTASNKASAFNAKSIRNDFNPLNYAGYEGKHKSEKFENPFINERTILVWVGYLMQAQKSIKELGLNPSQEQLAEIYSNLKKANKEILKTESDITRILPLGDIIRKHDAILNTLYSIGKFESRLFNALRNDHIVTKSEDNNKILNDAKRLLTVLPDFTNEIVMKQFKKRHSDQIIKQWALEIQELRDDINDHILTDRASTRRGISLAILENEVISKAKVFENTLDRNNLNAELLTDWAELLHAHAEAKQETIGHKNTGDFVYLGHSLGGGLAQVGTCDLVKNHRIPCPSQKLSTVAFDAPGIHREDNRFYKKFIKKHHKLFVQQNINFEIYHQHEVNDPIPAGGVHLGGASSKKNAAKLKNMSNFKFTGLLMERNPEAHHRDIRDAKTVHATRFLEGKEGIDYTTTRFSPKELGLLDLGGEFNRMEPEKAQEKARQLSDYVWHYPIRPSSANRLQTSTWFYNFCYFLCGDEWVEQDPRYLKEVDSRGMLWAKKDGLSSSWIG
ncbi:MAG: hypothetical protein H0W50_07795 [Parachlamydiaceae bacterium]|nr:hypothetical protein [Parachlamydiaceae bacterium]